MSILHKTLFTLQFRGFEFKPGWIPTSLTLCVLYLLISLSLWQFERAEYKADLEAKIEARQHLIPILYDLAPDAEEERLYLPVKINGNFDPTKDILLDNQVVNSRAGYNIFTPLLISKDRAVLVNRGWVPQGRTRQDLPEIITPVSNIVISGLLIPPSEKGVILSEQANDYMKWPVVVQYIDIKVLEKVLGYSLEPMIIILDENSDAAFLRKPVKLNMKSQKHMGYSIQWFTMAIVLLVIFFIVNTNRIEK